MKNLTQILTVLLCLVTIQSVAQEICGFDNIHQNLLKTNPDYVTIIAANNEQIRAFIAAHPKNPQNRNASPTTLYYPNCCSRNAHRGWCWKYI
jgi:hypothetical protein